MVNKLNNLITQVELEKGAVLLFMLWKNLPEDDTWSIVISASWIQQMGQSIALQYWISKVRSSLSQTDLSKINRIGFLDINDKIVRLITSSVQVKNAPVKFSKNQINDLYIEEAIIFRSLRGTSKRYLDATKRNPLSNHNINPIFNHNINPIFNHNINPIFNHNINPIFNHNINPIFNHNINPIFNHNINPIFNHNVNPIFNPNFSGQYLYNDKSQQIAYIIFANEEIILMFNLDNNLQAYGVQNAINGFTMFNNNQSWMGTMVPDGEDGFIFYSNANQQIGFVK